MSTGISGLFKNTYGAKVAKGEIVNKAKDLKTKPKVLDKQTNKQSKNTL